MDEERVWDVALSKAGSPKYPSFCFNIPRALSVMLVENSLMRATLRITEDGLLFTPYKAELRDNRARERVKLPESWGK